jgi:(p)ppGpp synthase/HD superfamily hydrolase
VLKPGIAPARLLSVDWDKDRDFAFPVEVSMLCEDRRNMLADVAKAIGDENVDITNADVRRHGAQAVGTFALQVKNLEQLEGVITAMSGVKGVYRVARKGEVTSG